MYIGSKNISLDFILYSIQRDPYSKCDKTQDERKSNLMIKRRFFFISKEKHQIFKLKILERTKLNKLKIFCDVDLQFSSINGLLFDRKK